MKIIIIKRIKIRKKDRNISDDYQRNVNDNQSEDEIEKSPDLSPIDDILEFPPGLTRPIHLSRPIGIKVRPQNVTREAIMTLEMDSNLVLSNLGNKKTKTMEIMNDHHYLNDDQMIEREIQQEMLSNPDLRTAYMPIYEKELQQQQPTEENKPEINYEHEKKNNNSNLIVSKIQSLPKIEIMTENKDGINEVNEQIKKKWKELINVLHQN